MKILKYKLVRKNGLLVVPDYIVDGGHFSIDGTNKGFLIGLSNVEKIPEGVEELSVKELMEYFYNSVACKLDDKTNMESVMSLSDKEDYFNAWLKEKGVIINE
jgi:hypothetical protein